MSEIGILEYRYNDFTYDSASKTYKADEYNISVSASLDATGSRFDATVTNATIQIKDGFPYKAEFDLSSSGSSVHYTCSYSNYGAIRVTLPSSGGGNASNLLGNEVKSSEFVEVFNKRPENPYNHAELNISGDVQNATVSGTYVYGVWEINGDGVDYSTFEALALSYDSLMSYVRAGDNPNTLVRYYINRSNNTYSFTYYQEVDTMVITAIMTYNQYFCLISEQADILGKTYNVSVKWSNVKVPSIMPVSGRSFVGVDLEETNHPSYEDYKIATQAMTMIFDKEGNFKMTDTVVNSGKEIYMEYFGSYIQNDRSVSITINVAKNGQQITLIPENDQLHYELEVFNEQLIMHMPFNDGDGEIVLHLIFECDGAYRDTIEIPTNGDGNDFGDLGTKITYEQFLAAYQKRPQASYTHVEGEYICQPDNVVYSVILDCVDGEWVSNGELSLDISSLVISDYTMSSLGEAMSSSESTISFYQFSSNVYNILIENSYVRQLLTLNEFFYLTHQCSVYESTTYTIDVLWS